MHRDLSDPHGVGNVGKEPGVLVVCELIDGTQLAGLCGAYDDEPGNEGKRDLLLRMPTVRYANGPSVPERRNAVNLVNYNNVVVNEQQIRWWTSKWLDPGAVTEYISAVLSARDSIKRGRWVS